ncbi:hypothetical protein ACFCVU_23690 [Peribacillus butanolivorans]|nr:hypothetical protein [Peribacillus butanolivorans]
MKRKTLKTWHEGKNADGGIQTDMRGLATTFHSIRHGAADQLLLLWN